MTQEHDHDQQGELPPEVEFVTENAQARTPGGDEGHGDGHADEQHHPRLPVADLIDRAGEEWPAAPEIHDGAEGRGDPPDDLGIRQFVADELGEHVIEDDYRDGDDEHDPEQAPELGDMAGVTAVTCVTCVILMSTVVVVTRVILMATVIHVVMVHVIVVHMLVAGVRVVLHNPVLPSFSRDYSAGEISLSTTHLWLIMVIPSISTSTMYTVSSVELSIVASAPSMPAMCSALMVAVSPSERRSSPTPSSSSWTTHLWSSTRCCHRSGRS